MKLTIALTFLCVYQVNCQTAIPPASQNVGGFIDTTGINNLINLINNIISNLFNNRRPIVSETAQTQPAGFTFPSWNIFNPFQNNQQPLRPPIPQPMYPPSENILPFSSSQNYPPQPNVRQRQNSKFLSVPVEDSAFNFQPKSNGVEMKTKNVFVEKDKEEIASLKTPIKEFELN